MQRSLRPGLQTRGAPTKLSFFVAYTYFDRKSVSPLFTFEPEMCKRARPTWVWREPPNEYDVEPRNYGVTLLVVCLFVLFPHSSRSAGFSRHTRRSEKTGREAGKPSVPTIAFHVPFIGFLIDPLNAQNVV